MSVIFTPYGSRQHAYEPRALLALKHVRGLEELLLGWVGDKRTLSISPICNQSQSGSMQPGSAVSRLDVLFSRAGRRVGGGALELDYLIPFLPPIPALKEGLDAEGAPDEDWFDRRNLALGIDLDPHFDLNRCPPRALAQLMLSYLVHPDAFCSVQALASERNAQLKIELVYLNSPDSNSLNKAESKSLDSASTRRSGLGWKETLIVHRTALENFVPHVYWV